MATVFDSPIFSQYLSDEATVRLLSDEQQIAMLLRVEIALAKAQATVGLIPAEAAQTIADRLANFRPDPQVLADSTRQNGVPIIGLLALAKKQLPESAVGYLHFGATSQDIIDTASVLTMQAVITLQEARIREIIQGLANLIERHSHTIAIARTRTQQAVPVLFGLKVSAWISPLLRHLTRLEQLRPRLLVVQLGGSAGSLAAMGDNGLQVSERLAAELQLGFLPTQWHSQRDAIVEYGSWLALVTGTLGKFGQDMLTMAQSEVGEVAEGGAGDTGKSSTMPHKSNPVLSETLVALARFNAGLAANLFHSLIHGNERDGTAWLLEWLSLPPMMTAAGTALKHASELSRSLVINERAMAKNVALSHGLVMSEAATFALTDFMPRADAQNLVQKACQLVDTDSIDLTDALHRLTPDLRIDWRVILQPENYLGSARQMIAGVLDEVRKTPTPEGASRS